MAGHGFGQVRDHGFGRTVSAQGQQGPSADAPARGVSPVGLVDRLTHALATVRARLKQGAGRVVGDTDLETDGVADQVEADAKDELRRGGQQPPEDQD